MQLGSRILLHCLVGAGSMLSVGGAASAAHAKSAPATISLRAMPLASALKEISAQAGVNIEYDPDAVSNIRSNSVRGARNASEAVEMAIKGHRLALWKSDDGRLTVIAAILVRAHTDEAESKLLVRQASTSSRTGQSLRDQARNTQVLSAKLLADQQAQTVGEALRNAGSVSVRNAAVQGGVTFSIRGFPSDGTLNGLVATTTSSVPATLTQSIANIERIEVLKGPDAMLAGANSLGGTINVVTKKASSDPVLNVSLETGSYEHKRVTVDAGNRLTADGKLSARLIATAADDVRNAGGYRGNGDYLLAPSIRYKDAHTDVSFGLSANKQSMGSSPYTPYNTFTNEFFDYPRGKPVFSKDQYLTTRSTQYYGEVTQDVGKFLTVVARGQHQDLSLDINAYTPLALLAPDGTILITTGGQRQSGASDSFDVYGRFKWGMFGIKNTLSLGYTYVHSETTMYSSPLEQVLPYNFLTSTAPPPAIATPTDRNEYLTGRQEAIYANYLAEIAGFHFTAGVRRNATRSVRTTLVNNIRSVQAATAMTPNFGLSYDIVKNISVFGLLAYGYAPTFTIDRSGNQLPDVRSRNMEIGAKLELFNKNLLINASYFQLRQSNLVLTDPVLGPVSVAGQEGKGIDLNVTGQILPYWSVQGSLTRTKYSYLTPSIYGNVVTAQARDVYSFNSTYLRPLNEHVSAGGSVGVYGRSSSSIDRFGTQTVPASIQFDANARLNIDRLSLNLGVQNIFNRTNYNMTGVAIYIPRDVPRIWRLTVGYRFQ